MDDDMMDEVEGSSSPPTTSSTDSATSSFSPPISPPNHAAAVAPIDYIPTKFDSLISTAKLPAHRFLIAHFKCPVCARPFRTEGDVSAHLDTCLTSDVSKLVSLWVADFLSMKPPRCVVEAVLDLLRSVVRDPENESSRNFRLGSKKVMPVLSMWTGMVELVMCMGFKLGYDGFEVWASMPALLERQVAYMKLAIPLLESWMCGSVSRKVDRMETLVEPKKIDRMVRVFFPVPENVAAKIELPDSFFDMSIEDIKREAVMRKKKKTESSLLIPKSFKGKQAMDTPNKYKLTVIRIQFPDDRVIQGIFQPSEPTTMLYEFVSSALKDISLEFELLVPSVLELRAISRFGEAGDWMPATLEEERLVPSALLKFNLIDIDSVPFSGLTSGLLEASETLTSKTTVF